MTVRTTRRASYFAHALFALLVATAASGCLPAGATQPHRESEEGRTLPTVGTRHVRVKTTDGYVRVRAAESGVDTIDVRAYIVAVGSSDEDAQDCLRAIEIASPVSGKDEATQEITWAWREPRQSQWKANVSFVVTMPPALDLAVETTNGQIDVVGTTGDCRLKTTNGAVRAVAATGQLDVEDTNGEVSVDTPAAQVQLVTVNGRIKAKLSNDKAVAGKLSTVNGEVRVAVPKNTAVTLACRTTNGKIKNDLPLKDVDKKGRTRLTGKLAGGGETLSVETTNGSITLDSYKTDED